jgi:hypothetical protein
VNAHRHRCGHRGCLALKRNQEWLLSNARGCFTGLDTSHSQAVNHEGRPWPQEDPHSLDGFWGTVLNFRGSRASVGSWRPERRTERQPPSLSSSRCPRHLHSTFRCPRPACTGQWRMPCSGNWTYRSARTQPATEWITALAACCPALLRARGCQAGQIEGIAIHQAHKSRLA